MKTMHTESSAARTRTHGLLALVAAAVLAACSSPVKLNNTAPVESRTGSTPGSTASTAGSANAGAAANAGTGKVTPVDLTKADAIAMAPAGRIVYFDFDSYVVKDEFRGVVEGNAKSLAADRKLRMSVEGHTDERGGREYNLALGQKRSEAVLKSLTLLGATDAQLEAVSFGKERPAATGSDEAAWAKNRRVELVSR